MQRSMPFLHQPPALNPLKDAAKLRKLITRQILKIYLHVWILLKNLSILKDQKMN